MKKFMLIVKMLIAAFSVSGCEQAVVDAQMEALCKKDGGMKIYEKVTLPKDQFKYGVPIFFSTWNESGGGYRFINNSEKINVEKPGFDILTWNHATLTKNTLVIIRDRDNKMLGTYVYYLRTGGAIMPRLGPDPTKLCPKNNINFLKNIFVSVG